MLLFLSGRTAAAQTARPDVPPRVLLAPFSGVISPVAAEFMTEAVSRAERDGFDAVVIQLDTPGGLDTSMRAIVKKVMNAKVPVIVFVHPSGSRAASAGVFITMAAHVAAMTPGTNIGAAHPVAIPTFGSGGAEKGKVSKVMEKKAVNDAATYLQSIAQDRGRNAEWAYEAVSKSSSIPASEALAKNVVDILADDVPGLLSKIDGREVPGFDKPLRTAGAAVDRHEMTGRQRLLATISNPNVAMILMSLGAGGLFIELYNPGLILPGIVGLICLILAFYSFHTLSASYAGVMLLLAGVAFFILEVKVTSYGLLALGGVVAMLLGVLMLFQQPMGGLSVDWSVITGSILGLLGLTALISWLVVRAYGRKIPTGIEGMAGSEGQALDALDPRGQVIIQGEIWRAVSITGQAIPKGADIVVEAVDSLRLKVRPK